MYKLKVAGTSSLVGSGSDLSICPSIVGATTNSNTLLIGEKAATIIAEEWRVFNI